MIYLGIRSDEPALSADERRWRREMRSARLRLATFGILVVNLLMGEHGGNLLVHANVVVRHGLATVLALTLAITRPWSGVAGQRLCGRGRPRWQISLSMVLVPTDAANIIPGIGLMAEVALVDACMLLVRDHH